jgi:hypothetical protein
MVFCPECGNEASDNAKFCSNCGCNFTDFKEMDRERVKSQDNIGRAESARREEQRHNQDRIERPARGTSPSDVEGLEKLVLIGYILAILGAFLSGLLSIGGLIVGFMIRKRSLPNLDIYGLNAGTHGIIIILISLVTLIIGIIVLILVLSIFGTVFGFMNNGFAPPF